MRHISEVELYYQRDTILMKEFSGLKTLNTLNNDIMRYISYPTNSYYRDMSPIHKTEMLEMHLIVIELLHKRYISIVIKDTL